MRTQMATTKAGLVAFQLQMQAAEANDANTAASTAQLPAAGQATHINGQGAIVTETVVTAPGDSNEEQMLIDLRGVSCAFTATWNAAGGDGTATD